MITKEITKEITTGITKKVIAQDDQDLLTDPSIYYHVDAMDSDSLHKPNDQDLISQWNNLSPQGNANTIQNTVAQRPKYELNGINGKPSILFDGVDDFMDTQLTFQKDITDGWTFFIVAQDLRATNGHAYFGFNDSGSGFGMRGGNSPDIDLYFDVKDGTGTSFLNDASTRSLFNDPFITTSLNDPINNQTRMYGNGSQVSIQPQRGTGASTRTMYLGYTNGTFGGLNSNMRIGEVIIFERTLPDSQRAAIEKYLSNKWGI